MYKIYLLLFIGFFINPNIEQDDDSLRPTSKTEVIKHTYYQLEYSEKHEQARWVYYTLTTDFINGNGVRKNNFRIDPFIKAKSATLKDYKGSGYDRGHLCPAAAMKLNQKAMDETFFMSNMSPQYPSFNRGKWKSLESQVRTWVIKEKKLHIATGAIFDNNIGTIGTNKVTIPGYYYKVIYDPTGEQKMIGFIMPNRKIENSINEYKVTVDEVERKTGIDFFSALPDNIENNLESTIGNWKISKTSTTSKSNTSKSTAIQCNGIAKSTGQRCKNMTTNSNRYCNVHQYQVNSTNKPVKKTIQYSGRCQAITKKGTQCKRNAEPNSIYCWQHQQYSK